MFVDEVCEGLALELHGLGSTTSKRPDARRGIEAHSCYCFDPANDGTRHSSACGARRGRMSSTAIWPTIIASTTTGT